MKPIFNIFNKTIKLNSPCLIIAEIGINHMGDVNLCEDMILSALDSGADCVKLQTANAKESYHPDTDSFEVFKGTDLTLNEMSHVDARIYDIQGREVAVINDGMIDSRTLTWTASDYASGIYFLQIIIDGQHVQHEKIVLLK